MGKNTLSLSLSLSHAMYEELGRGLGRWGGGGARGGGVREGAEVLGGRLGVGAAVLVQLALLDELLFALRHGPQAPPAAGRARRSVSATPTY